MAGGGDPHTKMELRTRRPEEDPHHQMEQAEDELRERQKPAVVVLGNWLASVEEVGEGGWMRTQGTQET